MTTTIRVKLLHPSAVVPVRREGDSGADLHMLHDLDLYPGCIERVGFGIAIEIPPGYEGQIRPRSGLMSRGFSVELGTVDGSFRGELGAVLVNHSRDDAWRIKAGDRVAQLVIVPVLAATYEASAELSATERGERGFGSTDR